ncbi:TetR/AcrR family transcriptional regulator [Nocardia sp. NPDC051030]|uniref:TetR/AcrR family transcriptional regulator n=1 Tax=Nocardia sp. NPDC051030 TaxID=3155162 RepID=UPI003415FC56
MTTMAGRQYGGRAVTDRLAERRQRFIDAAIALFAEHGYANSSLADLCAAAKLSKRQFYESFDSREVLLFAVYDFIQDGAAEAVTAKMAALGPNPDIHEAIAALVSAHLGYFGADPHRAKVAFVEVVGISDKLEQYRRERRLRWGSMLQLMLKTIGGPDSQMRSTADLAISALIGATNGLVHEWLLTDPRPPIGRLVDILAPMAETFIIPADQSR